MKKILSTTLALLLLSGACGMTAYAADAEASAEVYVSIADAEGQLALYQEAITVTDIDEDGALTINDALYAAHEAKFEGGAEAGYGSDMTDYGLSMTKLWGVENGGSYGYYVNNASAWSLTDPVNTGDYISAFVYTDTTAWSDTYCFFDVNTVVGKAGEEITLTLSAAGYDADYNPITVPVSDAIITVDGEATEYKTDAEGSVTIKLENAGSHLISATSETMTLVPPVCMAAISVPTFVSSTEESITEPESTTEAAEAATTATETTTVVTEVVTAPQTGSSNGMIVAAAASTALLLAAVAVAAKKQDEK